MLIGFNNDVEFNGHMFHIQTEDNGVKNASITTILFFQGQILDTKNGVYGDIIKQHEGDEEELQKAVKQRMVDLHRTLYKNLFDGIYVEHTERILRGKGKGTKSKSQPNLKQMPAAASGITASKKSGSRPQLSMVPANTSIARPQTGKHAATHSLPPERPHPEYDVKWENTGQEAFRGIIWPQSDFRIDGLVAQFLESLS